MGLSIFLSLAPANAQILQDTTALKLVKADMKYIYNLQFNEAREIYSKITGLYPEHPIVFLMRGILTYWENYPLLRTTPSSVSFEEDMRRCISLSEKNENPAYEAEYLLANMCASGMLLMFYDDNDMIKEVIPLVKSTYNNLRRAFDLNSTCPDLYYFTGLYNYYREGYPRAFPVYKSLLILFPSGDMTKGLNELKTAALNAVVLNSESYSLLSSIYLKFENNFSESLYYSTALHEQSPENVYYRINYIKSLLLMKQYDEAEKQIVGTSKVTENKFFQAQLMILNGILQEKKYNDYKQAQLYYSQGINDLSIFGKYGSEFTAYAYFGLSRIGESDNEKHNSTTYRKEAMKLATFKKINFDN